MSFSLKLGRFYNDDGILQHEEVLDLLNSMADENEQLKSDCDYRWKKYCNTRKEMLHEIEQLKSLNQELKNELKYDAKQYKVFLEVIDEADDLIKSHLSKHYQRQWKNFCKKRGFTDD